MGSVIWVLWQISYAFEQCKNFENRLRFDKVTESLMVGTLLRHRVFDDRQVSPLANIISIGPDVLTGCSVHMCE